MNNYKKYNGVLNVSGSTIRKIRESKGLSREIISARLMTNGVELIGQALYDIENNNRAIKDYELYFISIALNCSILDLLQDFIENLKD